MSNRALSPIFSVLGALLLAFVVGVFSASPFVEREVVHAQTAPALSDLTVTITDAASEKVLTSLSPTFNSQKMSYTMRASNAVDRITVDPTVTAGSTLGAITPVDAVTGGTHQVNLSVGTTTIRIPVTAGGTSSTYIVRVTRVPTSASSDTKLRTLTLSNVMLSPAFDPDERAGYTDKVPNSVSLTTVTARAANSGATVDIKYDAADTFDTDAFGTTGIAADSANVLPLVEGDTTIAIRVTAADVATMGYYTATVTRAAGDAMSVATLGDLSLGDPDDSGAPINISPTFAAATTAYTASVPYTVRKVIVTATVTAASDATRVITSNMGDTIGADDVVDLAVGPNVITVKVDAEDAIATETYTVTVTRASATASVDANLSSLNLSRIMLSPAFDPGKTAYTALVPNTVGLTIVTATAADSGAVVSIAAVETGDPDSVIDGNNVVTLSATATTTITVTVTAADGVNKKMYAVVVTRAAGDAMSVATLGDLSLGDPDDSGAPINISPTFAAATTAYTASVPYTVRKVIVTATVTAASDATRVITSNMGDTADDVVDLAVGPNVITVKVDAEDAIATETYTVTVTRASATASVDANLSSLNLSRIMLSPAFDPGKTAYTALVPNTVSVTTVTATAADSGAVVSIAAVETGDPDSVIDGNNVVTLSATATTTITVTVTAADGVNKKMYAVVVTRAAGNASDNANLGALKLDTEDTDGDVTSGTTSDDLYLNMPFIASRTEYTTTAKRSQSSIIVLATPEDADGAMVMVTSDGDEEVKDFTPTTTLIGGEKAFEVDLKHGPNVITITVTAADAVSMQAYKVTVTRQGASDSSLYSLSLSGITLEPAFAVGTTEYMSAETLGTDATMTTVMAMANHGGASVAISSNRDDDIGDDNVVDLHPGRNVITVMVTSEDQSAMTSYMVTVNVVASTDATLSVLSLWDGDDEIPIMPEFMSDTMSYTAEVASSVEMTTVLATAMHPAAMVTGTGERTLSAGENNVISVTVTAEDGATSQTYTVTVTVGDAPPVEEDLLGKYDEDDSGHIDFMEVSAAIDDYFDGGLTLEEVSAVIDLYFM